MEDLPTGIILQQLSQLLYKDILQTCKTNKRINDICNENENALYKRLIKRDFFDTIRYES
jgi:hypothetical protein